MFNFIKKLFKKNKKDKKIEKEIKKENSCENTDCFFHSYCGNGEKITICKNFKKPKIDNLKTNILLMDDNVGVVSFMEDLILEVMEEYNINKDDYNIIKLSGKLCGFEAIIYIDVFNIKIDKALLDLSLNGIIRTETKNLKLTGVDVALRIIKKNPEAKILFYTGNTMNNYIKEIKELKEKWKNIKNKDIDSYVLYKNEDLEKRKEIIYEKLFK